MPAQEVTLEARFAPLHCVANHWADISVRWNVFTTDGFLGAAIHSLTCFAVKVVFVDTLHLFPETITFLREVEERYGFKALYYTPKDFATYEEYAAVHGTDLPEKDIGECVHNSQHAFLCAYLIKRSIMHVKYYVYGSWA